MSANGHYFWTDHQQISDDVKNRLEESHKELLFDQLAIGM